MSWRNILIPEYLNKHIGTSDLHHPNKAIYQFGVFSGYSMVILAEIFSKVGLEFGSFYGFDPFTGMPLETAEPLFQDCWDPRILPDAFNAVKTLNKQNTTEVIADITDRVKTTFNRYQKNTQIEIFEGFCQDTLVRNKHRLKPAAYVDFDMDIYTPTKFALKFLLENKLIIRGTLIGYDDWGGTPDYETFKYGESRAHNEICNEMGVKMTKISEFGNCFPHVHNLWIVEDIK